jgi:hypothetical protein
MNASAALRLCLVAGFLSVGGCSDPRAGDKLGDPALKASMQKRTGMFEAKSKAAKKGNPAVPNSRP